MLDRDSVTAKMFRMAALGGDARCACDDRSPAGRRDPPRPSSMSQAFSSASTFWPNCAASVASRSPIAARRALASGGSARAGAGEIEMIALEHARLFGRKPELVLLGLERVDALEERLVQIDLAAMAREDRRDSRSIAWSSSLVAAPARLKKTLATRSRLRPLRSSASIVLAKVGDAGFAAMASISARCLSARRRRRAENGRARCARTAAPRTARSRVREAGSVSRLDVVMDGLLTLHLPLPTAPSRPAPAIARPRARTAEGTREWTTAAGSNP